MLCLRTFARKFSNIGFFLKILLLRYYELVMSETQKKWGVTDFVLERTCPEEHLNLSKSGFVSEERHSGCKSQNIAAGALKGNVLCQIWINRTYEANLVNWWGSSKDKFTVSDHSFTRLATSRWQDSMSRGQKSWNFFGLPTLIFCLFMDNVEMIVNKICFWKEKWGSPNVQDR